MINVRLNLATLQSDSVPNSCENLSLSRRTRWIIATETLLPIANSRTLAIFTRGAPGRSVTHALINSTSYALRPIFRPGCRTQAAISLSLLIRIRNMRKHPELSSLLGPITTCSGRMVHQTSYIPSFRLSDGNVLVPRSRDDVEPRFLISRP